MTQGHVGSLAPIPEPPLRCLAAKGSLGFKSAALKVCFLSQVTSIEAVVVDGMLET